MSNTVYNGLLRQQSNGSIPLGPSKLGETYENRIEDSGLEGWLGTTTPDDWSILGGAIEKVDGVTGFGIQVTGSGEGPSGIFQSTGSLTEDDEYIATVQAKASIANDAVFVFTSGSGENTMVWNFTGDDAGTWTTFGGMPTGDQVSAFSMTSEFSLQTSPTVTVPANGQIITLLVCTTASAFVMDDATLIKVEDTTNVLTNADFELWTTQLDDPNELADWDIFNPGFSGDETVTADTDLVYSGTYSAKITNDATNGYTKFITPKVAAGDFTEGDTVKIKLYARSGEGEQGTTSMDVIVVDDSYGSENITQVYDFDAKEWVEWTGPEGLVPGETIMTYSYVPEVSWLNLDFQYFSGSNVTAPASGKVSVIVGGHQETGTHNLYIDDVTISAVIPPEPVVICDLSNTNDTGYMDVNDSYFKMHCSGGIPIDVWNFRGDGSWTSSLARWQYKNFVIGQDLDGVDPGDLVTMRQMLKRAKTLLNKEQCVNDIDITQTGATSLYVVPTGYQLINANASIVLTGANTLTVGATMSIGTEGGSYEEIMPSTTLNSAFDTVGMYADSDSVVTSPIRLLIDEEGVVKANVSSGATATSATIKIYLFGTLVPIV